MTTRQYKGLKGLEKEDLRDNMSEPELVKRAGAGNGPPFHQSRAQRDDEAGDGYHLRRRKAA